MKNFCSYGVCREENKLNSSLKYSKPARKSTDSGPSNDNKLIEEARSNFARDLQGVRETLKAYVDDNSCPCKWPQFEFWVSKEQGPGWHDYYQNELVQAAIQLECFERSSSPNNSGTQLNCKKCGRTWIYSSHEWRMEAFKHKLVPLSENYFTYPALVGAYFATAGSEPVNHKVIDFKEWKLFMSANDSNLAIHNTHKPNTTWLSKLFKLLGA